LSTACWKNPIAFVSFVAIVEGDHDLALCSSIDIARLSFSVPQLRGEMVMLDIARF
jgi:hypothetical protein